MADGTPMLVADAAFAFQTLDMPAADLSATGPQPILPTGTGVKLFLYDMIQGASAAAQGNQGLFVSDNAGYTASDTMALPACSMDLLAEHAMRHSLV